MTMMKVKSFPTRNSLESYEIIRASFMPFTQYIIFSPPFVHKATASLYSIVHMCCKQASSPVANPFLAASDDSRQREVDDYSPQVLTKLVVLFIRQAVLVGVQANSGPILGSSTEVGMVPEWAALTTYTQLKVVAWHH